MPSEQERQSPHWDHKPYSSPAITALASKRLTPGEHLTDTYLDNEKSDGSAGSFATTYSSNLPLLANPAQHQDRNSINAANPADSYPRPSSGAPAAKMSISLTKSMVKSPEAPIAPYDADRGAIVSKHPYSGEEIVVLPGPSDRPAYERSLFVTGSVFSPCFVCFSRISHDFTYGT